ncbi:MAG: 4-hydroxythreonine-4-phosphate dehydrogenase PdxA [Candidatus Cloacimonas sp. 4484_209]|nr:MAG: 4-hydroxythreonine-4-phosphate dehydrogenase PdxA [Candidatus Cloacimonas sp. 4484_209]
MTLYKIMTKIGITIGDPSGIGPEVIIKSLNILRKIEKSQFTILAPYGFLEEYAKRINIPLTLPTVNNVENSKKKITVLPVMNKISFLIGKPTASSGETAYRIIKYGIEFAMAKKFDAIVTAPVSKYDINLAGKRFTGHTEMLMRMSGSKDVLMFFVSPKLKAGVVTTHIGIKRVSPNITIEKIFSKLQLLAEGLKKYFLIKAPRIGVSALNPHAGEGGYIGDEENKIILPAIKKAKIKGILAEGPFPADTIIKRRNNYDALLFMYHDQAMIPVKLLSWGNNVNVTLGLPFIRTSPDHGTAFDIAGKGIASTGSFIQAVKLACKMVENARLKT